MTSTEDPRPWVERASLELSGGVVDFARSRFLRSDGGVETLSAREAELLAYLSDHPNEIVARDELLTEVWGHSDLSMSRAADTAIARLRRKIEPDPSEPQMLLTDHGYGYRLLTRAAAPVVVSGSDRPRRLLSLDDVTVDLSAGYADGPGGRIALTAQERLLLEELLRHRGAAVERRKLARRVGIASVGAVRSAIHRLRHKIEPDPASPRFLVAVSGGSYRLEAMEAEPELPLQARLEALRSLADHVGRVLGFSDCVVYLREGELLRQVAAHGPKRGPDGEVQAPLTQTFEQGLVGAAASSAEPISVPDVSTDGRYLQDLVPARSELSVPVLNLGHVVGVIDAESPLVNAFQASHSFALASLATIAAPAFARLQGVSNG